MNIEKNKGAWQYYKEASLNVQLVAAFLGVPDHRISEVLILLHDNSAGMTMGNLCEATGIKPSSMTAYIDALEVRGIVRRKFGKKDRRSVIISLIRLPDLSAIAPFFTK